MTTLTATAIEQQFMNHYYSTSSLTESSFEVLDYMELELESILLELLDKELLTDFNSIF